MQIEREEYLEAAKSQGLADKSNGFYKRNYRSLLKNHLQINIPKRPRRPLEMVISALLKLS